ncbi:hypothetical protein HOLleu_21460 [Holothuria leucospilota]|uniref:Uncharacterized protein n=1 Tax=Holothuria leucospilota TaxID=206669 RepID=A0A9Q1BXU5_HOLLE|nr:hypothetical protein HOLleu_21460 [Holothuria leucospilota]
MSLVLLVAKGLSIIAIVRSNQLTKPLNVPDAAYRCRDTDPNSYRKARSCLSKAIRDAKRTYRHRIEKKFQSGDSRALWSSINLITQYKGTLNSVQSDDVTLPDRLNEFYARFDLDNNSEPSPAPCDDDQASFVVSDHDVRRSFCKLDEHKASGPDGITPRLLKLCCSPVGKRCSRKFLTGHFASALSHHVLRKLLLFPFQRQIPFPA